MELKEEYPVLFIEAEWSRLPPIMEKFLSLVTSEEMMGL